MTTTKFQAFYDEVRGSVRGVPHGAGALAAALSTARGQVPERQVVLESSVRVGAGAPDELTRAGAIGMVADVVSAATSEAIQVVNREDGAQRQALLHQLVDLWAQAEAIRALWFERYVKWPEDRVGEKDETLTASTRLLCAGMASVAMAEGWDWSQLAELLGETSGLAEGEAQGSRKPPQL